MYHVKLCEWEQNCAWSSDDYLDFKVIPVKNDSKLKDSNSSNNNATLWNPGKKYLDDQYMSRVLLFILTLDWQLLIQMETVGCIAVALH